MTLIYLQNFFCKCILCQIHLSFLYPVGGGGMELKEIIRLGSYVGMMFCCVGLCIFLHNTELCAVYTAVWVKS